MAKSASGKAFLLALGFVGSVTTARSIYIATSAVPTPYQVDTTLVIVLALLALGSYFTWISVKPIASALLNALGLLFLALDDAWLGAALVFHTGRRFPLVDPELAAVDRMIGFDWVACLKWFDLHPVFDSICQVAYQSIFVQAIPLIVALALARQTERLYALLVAMTGGVVVTTLIALALPAFGPYEFFHVSAADHPNIVPITAAKMTAPIVWLRDGTFASPFPELPAGLISFPSYHATGAVIYFWAWWRIPVIKWLALGLNALMLIATPVHGSHYLVDVLAGMAIGIVSIIVSVRAIRFLRGDWRSLMIEPVPAACSVFASRRSRSPRAREFGIQSDEISL